MFVCLFVTNRSHYHFIIWISDNKSYDFQEVEILTSTTTTATATKNEKKNKMTINEIETFLDVVITHTLNK